MAPLILIVDDEPTIRDVLTAVLADEGFRVACAADGREALDVLDATVPDLLITDVSMPHMTGLELVGRLRARGDGIPVVMMSTHYAGADLPGVRFVAKPFDLDAISAAVRRALAGRVPCP